MARTTENLNIPFIISAIAFLEKILFNPKPGESLSIPEWFKMPTLWWSNNQVPDTIYGSALQFLIDERVITIPIDQQSLSQESSSDKTL